MDSGGGMVPIGRTSHPPISGGPISLATPSPTFASNLPTIKPTSVSCQSGTKFHSSHASLSNAEMQYNSNHSTKGPQENDVQTLDSGVQYPRHRIHRRTKDQDNVSKANNNNALPSIRESAVSSNNNTQYNRGVQFDLEASAFPPLPGLDADLTKTHNASIETVNNDNSSQSQNRLSDVVKGTAKLKNIKEKDSATNYQQQLANSSRSASPGSSAGGHNTGLLEATTGSGGANTPAVPTVSISNPSASNTTDSTDIALSTITLTPPSSPDK